MFKKIQDWYEDFVHPYRRALTFAEICSINKDPFDGCDHRFRIVLGPYSITVCYSYLSGNEGWIEIDGEETSSMITALEKISLIRLERAIVWELQQRGLVRSTMTEVTQKQLLKDIEAYEKTRTV